MRPEFGCGVHDFVFDSIDANTIGNMEQAIREALLRWEPRIDVTDVKFDASEAVNGLLTINIEYKVRATNTDAQPRLPVLRHPGGGDGVRLPEIELDDRRFQDLVSEARTRISRSCPEWTEHNVSDPGITLIELFAWMTEMTIYRLNRVPDKLHVALLDLLGIRLDGPTAATTSLRFRLADAPTEPILIEGGVDRGRHAAHLDRRVGHLPGRRGLHDPRDGPGRLRAPAHRPVAQERRRGRRRGAPAGLRPARVRHAAAGRRRALHRLRGPAGPPDHPDRHGGLAGPRRRREPRGPAAALGGLPGRQPVGCRRSCSRTSRAASTTAPARSSSSCRRARAITRDRRPAPVLAALPDHATRPPPAARARATRTRRRSTR